MSDTESTTRVWITREWGRNWVGCRHGVSMSGNKPVRICDSCFDAVLREREDQATERAYARVRVNRLAEGAAGTSGPTPIPVTSTGSKVRDDCPGPANREGHHGGDPDCICYGGEPDKGKS